MFAVGRYRPRIGPLYKNKNSDVLVLFPYKLVDHHFYKSWLTVVDIDTGLIICNASHENIFLGEPKRFR